MLFNLRLCSIVLATLLLNMSLVQAEVIPNVMPLGDSITAGGDASYRRPLYYLITANTSLQLNYVGTRYQTSTCPECSYYEAYGGWTPAQILNGDGIVPHLSVRLSQVNPDIVILHAGTNGCDAAAVAFDPLTELYGSHVNTIKEILDTLFLANPQMRVVLAQIIQPQVVQPYILEFNNQLQVLYNSYEHKNSIILVNLESTLTEPADYIDTYHPSAQGYEKMALAFYPALIFHITAYIRRKTISQQITPAINFLIKKSN